MKPTPSIRAEGHGAASAVGPIRPTRAEIDLAAAARNCLRLKDVAGGAAVYAVCKADGYGHGVVPLARAFLTGGQADALAVSLVEEGIELRDAGISAPILVMGGAYGSAHDEVLARGLTPVISDLADVEAFAKAALRRAKTARVHLKVDTGMSRLGVRHDAVERLLEACARRSELVVAGLMTHLACADAADPAPTREQLARFSRVLAAFEARGMRPAVVHAANSAALLRFPEARFDAVRPGLALYGCGPQDGVTLEPVMRFVSAIVQLRDVPAGQAVSYGGLWRATAPSRIATLPVGYADGYPRRLTGAGEVLVRGRRCPVVGAVCMDMIMIDVTALGDTVRVGDEAVLLGEQRDERITARELAHRAGLIEYEILCGISKRVPRTVRA